MEKELKLALVRPEELERLLEALPTPRAILAQANHYLVCVEGRTAREKVMVRLRIEERGADRRACLTLKRRVGATRGVFVSWELEEPLPVEDALAVMEGERQLMELDHPATRWLADELQVSALRHQGSLLNLRHVIDLDGYVLEVDRSAFPDGSCDVEIEIETEDPEGARRAVSALAQRAAIELVEQSLGKYTRYLRRGGQS